MTSTFECSKKWGDYLLAIRIGFTSDPLAFEDLEETLRHRVIMTIATFAHAGLEPVIPQKSCQS